MEKLIIVLLFAISINVWAQDDAQDDPPPPPPGTFQGEEEGSFDSERDSGASRSRGARTDRSGSRSNSRGGGSSPKLNANPGFDSLKQRRAKVPFSEADAEDITNENFPELIESFDYPNADIADVVKAISELTGKNFIIDPNVRGKITIIAPTQITKAEAYKAFLTALAMNGFTVVPSGKFLKIKNARAAQRDSINTYSGEYSPDTDQMITRIIQLKHISAAEIQKSLRILPSKDGEMAVYASTNSLIFSDYGSNIQRVMRIIEQLDVPGFEEQLEVIVIQHAKAKDIADLIDKIINKDNSSGSSSRRRSRRFSSGVRRFGSGDQGGNSTSLSLVTPDERTNSIIVVGNQAGIDKIKELVAKLDFRIDPADAGGVYVYYMKYAEAAKVAEILTGIAQAQQQNNNNDDQNNRRGGARVLTDRTGTRNNTNNNRNNNAPEAGGGQGLLGPDVQITADESINSLIITASRQDFESVKSLLEKIDIPRNQVNVETYIMEISSQGQKSWGASYFKFQANDEGEVVSRAGFDGGNLESLLNPASSSGGAILGFGSGEDVTLNLGQGSPITLTSLVGLITFLQQVTDVNVLSTPNVTVLDNEEAEIEVGRRVPVTNDTTVTQAGAVNSPTREPVSTKLKIKPRISPGSDFVRLELEQQVQQVVSEQAQSASALAQNAITTSERTVKTHIVVTNKDTAVLGGLVREAENYQEQKVPILGDIPIIGWLFKSTQNQKEKRNLVMFITPTIVRTPVDARELRDEKIEDRLNFIKRNMGGRDPYGRYMDKISRAKNGSEFQGESSFDELSGEQELDPTEPEISDSDFEEGEDL